MPRKSEPKVDPATVRANAITCRNCAELVSYDEPEPGDVIRCECGTINLVDVEA